MANEKKPVPLLPGSTEPEMIGTVGELLNRWRDRIVRSLPKYIDPERFVRIVLTTLRQNEFLQKCSPESIIGSVMEAAADGLELDGVEAAMVPYWNKDLGSFEAQYQPMYQGLLKVCRRSGEILAVHAHEVYEGDVFRVQYGSHPEVSHEPRWETSDEEKITHWYVVFDLKSGGQQCEIMPRAEMLDHRKHSRSFQREKNSPWKTNLKMMGRKTVLRRGMKLVPTDDHAREVVARDDQRELVLEAVPIEAMAPAPQKQPPALEAAKTLFGEVARWFRHTGADDPKGEATKVLRSAVPKESMVEWDGEDVVAARTAFDALVRKGPAEPPAAAAEAPPPAPPPAAAAGETTAPPKQDAPEAPPEPPPAAHAEDAFVEKPTAAPPAPKDEPPAKLAGKRGLEGAAKAMRRWCSEVGVDDPSSQEAFIDRYWRELGAPDADHVPEALFDRVRKAADTEDTFKVFAREWARETAAAPTEGGAA